MAPAAVCLIPWYRISQPSGVSSGCALKPTLFASHQAPARAGSRNQYPMVFPMLQVLRTRRPDMHPRFSAHSNRSVNQNPFAVYLSWEQSGIFILRRQKRTNSLEFGKVFCQCEGNHRPWFWKCGICDCPFVQFLKPRNPWILNTHASSG